MITTITAATPTRMLAAIPIPNTPGRRGGRKLPYVTRSTGAAGCCVVMIYVPSVWAAPDGPPWLSSNAAPAAPPTCCDAFHPACTARAA